MSDFGFVGASYIAPSIYQDDQECINWYPEIDPTKFPGGQGRPADRGIKALYPTPGLTLQTTLADAVEVRGLHVLPGSAQMIAVCGASVYVVNAAFSANKVGTLNTNSGPVGITDNGSAAMIIDGTNRWAYTWLGSKASTFTQLTDGPFNQSNVCDEVDGFMIYNGTGSNQWGCTDANATTSSSLNFGSKSSSSDNVVGLIADKRNVLVIGEKTTEHWIDVGAFPFPFQIIPGTMFQHGCAARWSIQRFGETTAWLAQDTRGQAVVIQMNGYQPQRISTHAVENDIKNGVISDAVAFVYQQTGHEFYVLNFPTQDKTWAYDLATQLWHKRAYRDSLNVLHRHRGNCAANFAGQIVVGDWQNGNLYTFSTTNYTDNGMPIPCIRRAPHLTEGLNRVFYSSLQLQFQPGVGIAAGQGSDPQAMLQWSDDGGSTWSSEHWASIGAQGKYKNRALWRRLGAARDRIFQVTVTDPVYRAVISAELNAEAGAN